MIKNIIIVVLAIVPLICVYNCTSQEQPGLSNSTALQPEKSLILFKRAISDSEALSNIDDFRKKYKLDMTKGVYYDPATIRQYLDSILPYLQKRMGDSAGYQWMIGFYPMRKFDTNKNRRLDYVVIPVRVKTANDSIVSVMDFFDNPAAYKMVRSAPAPTSIGDFCDTCVGYDAGHLWP